jgi:hypothetical protein
MPYVGFATDWPISEVRGKCVSVGDQFMWIYPCVADAPRPQPNCLCTIGGRVNTSVRCPTFTWADEPHAVAMVYVYARLPTDLAHTSLDAVMMPTTRSDNTELSPSGADPENETESAVTLIGFETLRAVRQVGDDALQHMYCNALQHMYCNALPRGQNSCIGLL